MFCEELWESEPDSFLFGLCWIAGLIDSDYRCVLGWLYGIDG